MFILAVLSYSLYSTPKTRQAFFVLFLLYPPRFAVERDPLKPCGLQPNLMVFEYCLLHPPTVALCFTMAPSLLSPLPPPVNRESTRPVCSRGLRPPADGAVSGGPRGPDDGVGDGDPLSPPGDGDGHGGGAPGGGGPPEPVGPGGRGGGLP